MKGFTLIELLVVIAIIGILASFVFISFPGFSEKARIARAESMLGNIYSAIMQLEVTTGCWPKTPAEANCKTPYVVESGAGSNEIWNLGHLDVGILGDNDNAFPGWSGPYLDKIPKDPWGNDYFMDTDYDIDPTAGETWAVVIGSFGPNGQGQNLYDDDDVIRVLVSE